MISLLICPIVVIAPLGSWLPLAIAAISCCLFNNSIFKKKDSIKFIHLIRDPRDNYASLKSGIKSHYSKIGESNLILLSSMINRAKLDFKFIITGENRTVTSNSVVIGDEFLLTKG